MQRLDLDFTASRRDAPWAGWLLLAIAAAVCADTGLGYWQLDRSLAENQARLAQRAPAGAKASPQEVAMARETVQRLSLPWDRLFGAIESAASDQVTLAAIEPDPKAGKVLISGDGKDYLAALTYVLNLSQSEGLDRVELVRHEQKGNGIHFAVSAAWSTK
jgi:hypothetical protein